MHRQDRRGSPFLEGWVGRKDASARTGPRRRFGAIGAWYSGKKRCKAGRGGISLLDTWFAKRPTAFRSAGFRGIFSPEFRTYENYSKRISEQNASHNGACCARKWGALHFATRRLMRQTTGPCREAQFGDQKFKILADFSNRIGGQIVRERTLVARNGARPAARPASFAVRRGLRGTGVPPVSKRHAQRSTISTR